MVCQLSCTQDIYNSFKTGEHDVAGIVTVRCIIIRHFLSVVPSFAGSCVFIFEKNTALAKSIVWIATVFITLS